MGTDTERCRNETLEHLNRLQASIKDTQATIAISQARVAEAEAMRAAIAQVKAAYDALRTGRLTIPGDESHPS